jgi:hypothetical protein
MPWNGSGVFARIYSWANDALNNINIQGARMDSDTNDIVAGLNNCITRDGQGQPTGPINWAGQRLYNFAAPTVALDAASKGYVDTAAAIQAKNMAGFGINNLATPALSTDAATKGYVDNASLTSSLPGLSTNLGKVLTGTGGNVTWTFPGISTVNATITTSTTLSGSYLFVPIIMATTLQAVTLPDATTLFVGGPQYWMRNDGVYPAEIRDNSGVLICVLPVRGQIILMLRSNSTAAGSWSVGNLSEYANLTNYVSGPTTIDSSAVMSMACCALSSTTFALTYYTGGGGTVYVVAFTISGTTISFGTVVGFGGINNYGVSAISPISSSSFIVMSSADNAFHSYAMVFTVSGNTLTLGTQTTLSSATTTNSGPCAICGLSSTNAIAIYTTGGGVPQAVAMTLSGQSIVPGTPISIGSLLWNSTSYTPSITSTGLNTGLVIGMSGSSNMAAFMVSVSGTTITTGSQISPDSGCTYNNVVSIGGGKYAVVYTNGSLIKLVILTVSGTTVTAGSPVTVANGTYGAIVAQTAQGGTGYVYYSVSGSAYYAAPFSVSGTTITVGTSVQVSGAPGSSNAVAAFLNTGGQDVLVTAAGNYPAAQTVEFVK